MININWGIFLNNFPNSLNNGIQNSEVKNPNPLNTEHKNYQPTKNSQNTASLFPQTTEHIAKTVAELVKLNQQQMINMLKELLNMPKDFENLVFQLAEQTAKTPAETALLLLASTLNMGQLSSILQNSSKEAMAKLYKMIAQYNQLGTSVQQEQLNEVVKLVSFTMASSSSDVQTLRTTMLMYLPWFPLTDAEAFKLKITKEEENKSDSLDDNVTILISTRNYGNIKTDIFKTNEDGIRIDFISSKTFPQKEFNDTVKEISKKYNINININFAEAEVLNKGKNNNSKTQVSMHISPRVNPFLLLVSNSVIKNIHSIDEKENLKEARKNLTYKLNQ